MHYKLKAEVQYPMRQRQGNSEIHIPSKHCPKFKKEKKSSAHPSNKSIKQKFETERERENSSDGKEIE